MKVALVTTPPLRGSGIGDYTRDLLPHLARHVEVEVFVEDGLEGGEVAGRPTRPLSELDPMIVDRILYQLGNERSHAFMLPAIREFGGTVVLHDWVLFDLAMGGVPGLEQGGWRGHLAALKAGGLSQARVYARARSARRRQRSPEGLVRELKASKGGPGGFSLLEGWHEWEGEGRWSSGWSLFSIELAGDAELELEVDLPAGRTLELLGPEGPLGSLRGRDGARLRVPLPGGSRMVLGLRVTPPTPTPAQRRAGDDRVLGAFVRSIRAVSGDAEQTLDLTGEATGSVCSDPLPRARFDLPLNRPVVRLADAFIVHSDWMRSKILDERNAPTPIGLVPHGSTPFTGEANREEARRALGLPTQGTIVTSFGAIQEHKRPEPLLRAFALACKEVDGLHLVMAGEDRLEHLDLSALVEELGIRSHLTVTGFLAEEDITRHLVAADMCINLRGPSTGGTSGAIARALGVGRLVVTSDRGEQAEWPEACVRRVPVGEGEVASMRELIAGLARDGGSRLRAETAARDFVRNTSSWERVGAGYAGLLARLPCHHSRARSLITEAVDAADERRRERREQTS
jgi:glycosyltransferase involved in cell wall biosynthesis